MILDSALHTEPLFNIDAINSAYDFQWDEHYYYPGEYHDFPEIVYVKDGAVQVTENERVYNMEQGDWILHDAMEYHNIRSAAQTHPRIFIISFYTPGILPDNLTNGVFTLSPEERSAFENLFSQIYEAFPQQDTPAYSRQLLALDLSAFLIRLSDNKIKEQKLSNAKNALDYKLIVEAMQRNVHANMTLTDLSKECHVSVSYMKSLFNKNCGITPKLYYAKLRRAEALRLLTRGMPINEVAERMNFSSPNYFSLFMKKQLGMTISEYLKSKPTIIL